MLKKDFKVNGSLAGLKDSTVVFITDAQGNTIAQDYALGGKFTLQGKTPTVSYFQLGVIGNKDIYEIFIGNENLTITGNANAL